MFLFTANLIHRELDIFDTGCDPDTGVTEFFGADLVHLELVGESLSELVNKVCKYFNVDITSILLNSCDELGRLDVQTYTKGTTAIKCSYDKYQETFKAGDHGMYLNNISGTVTQRVEALDLTKILREENKNKTT